MTKMMRCVVAGCVFSCVAVVDGVCVFVVVVVVVSVFVRFVVGGVCVGVCVVVVVLVRGVVVELVVVDGSSTGFRLVYVVCEKCLGGVKWHWRGPRGVDVVVAAVSLDVNKEGVGVCCCHCV